MTTNSTGTALRNPTFRKLWIAAVISGTCVAAHDSPLAVELLGIAYLRGTTEHGNASSEIMNRAAPGLWAQKCGGLDNALYDLQTPALTFLFWTRLPGDATARSSDKGHRNASSSTAAISRIRRPLQDEAAQLMLFKRARPSRGSATLQGICRLALAGRPFSRAPQDSSSPNSAYG